MRDALASYEVADPSIDLLTDPLASSERPSDQAISSDLLAEPSAMAADQPLPSGTITRPFACTCPCTCGAYIQGDTTVPKTSETATSELINDSLLSAISDTTREEDVDTSFFTSDDGESSTDEESECAEVVEF